MPKTAQDYSESFKIFILDLLDFRHSKRFSVATFQSISTVCNFEQQLFVGCAVLNNCAILNTYFHTILKSEQNRQHEKKQERIVR